MFNSFFVDREARRKILQGKPLSFLCNDFVIKLSIRTKNNPTVYVYIYIVFLIFPRNLIKIIVIFKRLI